MHNSNAENWNERALSQGHTGWANPHIYRYDQPLRIQAILKLIKSSPFSMTELSVLDFGCGTGDFSFAVANLGAKVTGIDISDVVIERAKQIAGGKSNAAFETSSDSFFTKRPEKFNMVLSITVLQHLNGNELKKTLRQLFEVMVPGGYLLAIEMVRGTRNPDNRTSPIPRGHEDWLKEFNDCGFELIKITSYPQWATTVLSRLAKSVPSKQNSVSVKTTGLGFSFMRKIVTRLILMIAYPVDHLFRKSTPVTIAPYSVLILRRP